MSKGIYDLKLHESLELSNANQATIIAMRVSGGWIYTLAVEGESSDSGTVSQVFVPYNKDLKPEQSTQTIDIGLTGDKDYGKEESS